MVYTMLSALPSLLNVLVLLLVFFLLFGLTGVEMFGGAFRRHCATNITGNPLDEIVDVDQTCRVVSAPAWQGGYYCNVDAGEICIRTTINPNVGTTTFDNFPGALLALYQSITLEGWVYITYWAMDGAVDFAALYFVLVPLLGSFFFMNLFLATVQSMFQ
jgi:hypothetical protein